jgi:hypothetical protein
MKQGCPGKKCLKGVSFTGKSGTPPLFTIQNAENLSDLEACILHAFARRDETSPGGNHIFEHADPVARREILQSLQVLVGSMPLGGLANNKSG